MQGTRQGTHCRNYSKLAIEFPISEIDINIQFFEESHQYIVRGETVPRSATKIVSHAIAEEPFDSHAVILKNLSSWRSKPRSKYGAMIRDLSDEDATQKITALWTSANELGTKLHKRFEAHLNDDVEPDDGVTDVEWRLLDNGLSKLRQLGWVPRRTELSLWWERASDGKVVCAGQIDALFSDVQGEIVLVDLKRTDHDLSADVVPFREKACRPPLERFYANDFIKYSLQLSIYAVMFFQRTGIEIAPDRRWLLQAHPYNESLIWTMCRCLDTESILILDSLN